MRRRILFVDDESRVLDGQRRMLRDRRETWDMTFALGGEAALRELAAAPFDVVVTDMRMPGLDGASLLLQVVERWPRTVRVVLSGQTDMASALRAVRVAHQFLTKPCGVDTLYAVVERACRLTAMLADDDLRAAVAGIGALPSQPAVYAELERAIARPDVGLTEVARIVERDTALTAKLLQLVNSSFFGLPRAAATLEQATSYLGVEVLRSLVLSQELSGMAASGRVAPGFSLDDHQRRAWCTAALARRMLRRTPLADDAFLAAILHDVGELVLATRDPAFYTAAAARAAEGGLSLADAEHELRGITHATVGAFLLSLWGLPFRIVEAVLWHHTPGQAGGTSLDVLGAVHIADALTHEVLGGSGPGAPPELDAAYVAAIGETHRIDGWRAEARELVAGGGGR